MCVEAGAGRPGRLERLRRLAEKTRAGFDSFTVPGADANSAARLDWAFEEIDRACVRMQQSLPTAHRARAARLLFEVVGVGEQHGVAQQTWADAVDLPAVCLAVTDER